MSYTIENALFQWEEWEARVREEEGRDLDQAARYVVDALLRLLGGAFTLDELVAFYAEGTDWVSDEVQRRFYDVDSSAAVNAGFLRYARSAMDYAGGRRRILEETE
ncbi:MAG: hypothetical protein QOE38_628 [Thermoleophilaceae bacterium]|nr:hypothetical protein [Thermoleophilaceae bacterium]